MTQEQLAEALGVTVGAVSKWESGASTPELGLIVEMADFFETSVDVLLGYDWRAGGMGQTVERIRALRNGKQFDEGGAEAEKALKKYPNSFEIVFQSAILYSMKGVERRCQRSYRRSLELFERSLELIDQNTNERINEWTIKNRIADLYLCLGQNDKALELMKKNNADGVNNVSIGFTLAVAERKPEEALPYLSDALIDYTARLFQVVVGYTNAYCQQECYDAALEILDWMRGIIRGLRNPDAPSYQEKLEAQLLTAGAVAAALGGDEDRARDFLREARALAAVFDAAPEYGFQKSRFFHGEEAGTAFDDFGATTMEGIRNTLIENKEQVPALLRIWEELQHEHI